MAMDHSALAPDQVISDRDCRLDADTVAMYVDAVGDQSGIFDGDGGGALSPPMAVAAFSLRGVISDLAVPGGTLHVGQELEFHRAIRVGETLTCRATVLKNSARRGWRFLIVQQAVHDSKGHQVMTGKSTIMLPLQAT